ncbi:SEC-C metal-binding domain-containing protein [Rhodanobacter sp. BL-MT-08]
MFWQRNAAKTRRAFAVQPHGCHSPESCVKPKNDDAYEVGLIRPFLGLRDHDSCLCRSGSKYKRCHGPRFEVLFNK